MLVKLIKVEITPILGDKRNNAIIWGRFAPDGIFSSNKVSLGMYSTMKNPITEINEIEKYILYNPNGAYIMKSNEQFGITIKK